MGHAAAPMSSKSPHSTAQAIARPRKVKLRVLARFFPAPSDERRFVPCARWWPALAASACSSPQASLGYPARTDHLEGAGTEHHECPHWVTPRNIHSSACQHMTEFATARRASRLASNTGGQKKPPRPDHVCASSPHGLFALYVGQSLTAVASDRARRCPANNMSQRSAKPRRPPRSSGDFCHR